MVACHRLSISIRSLLVLLFAVVGSTGCTYHQLRKNTANQALTISELHQQQVLDNVAMFVNNKDALPFFALPTQGTSEINDKGAITPLLTWSRLTTLPLAGSFLFNTAQTTMTAERAARQNWTLNPINDPRKLELMRCAYQRAIGSCCGGSESDSCPNCSERFNRFYTGSKDKKPDVTNVTAECLNNTCCWFRVGTKHEVPNDCCNFVGKYCDTYVWVPHSGRDTLSKLTLVILDFALNDSKKTGTKEVVYYLNSKGEPTNQFLSVGKVTANISVSEKNESILQSPYKARIAEILYEKQGAQSESTSLSINDLLSVADSDSEYQEIIGLLEKIGAVTPVELKSLRTKDFNAVRIEGVDGQLDTGSQLGEQKVDLSTPATSNDTQSSLGPPPLLQLNQLLETVR
jgi:hypothetical protein